MRFITYLINGISLGSIYAIIALGYTMVYGIAKMLNFAHGDVIMIGCYVVFMTMSGMNMNPLLSVILAVVVCTVLGVIIEKVAYKPLRKASPLAVLITAIGVSYLLQNIALLIFGADTKSFSSVVPLQNIKIGGITITGVTVVAVLACIVIMIGLMIFIKKTKAGQAMLAVSEDKDAAQLMGVNVNGTISLTFAIGSGLAAIAGVLLCSAYPWYQSIYCSCIWWNRFHSGSIYRRNSSWYYRNLRKSLYFFTAFRCYRFCRIDYRVIG